MQLSKSGMSNQVVALACILLSSVLAFDVFLYSRNDHDMKLLALGSVISQVSALMATASTILVGRSFESGNRFSAADLPPGTLVKSADSMQTPPITPVDGDADASVKA